MKLTPDIAQALANLRTNRDFKTILGGFAEHITEETQRCVDSDGPVQLRASGAVKALQFWIKSESDAPAALEKFKNQQTGKNTP